MPSATFALTLLWIGWLISWLVASGWTARTVTQQSSRSRMAQSVPIWIGAILIARSSDWIVLFRPTPLIEWSAVALVGLGFALTWWARVHLGRFWSAAVTVKADHSLIRSGPYRLTRHPIYTGILLAVAATALARGTLTGVLGVGCVGLGLVLKLCEEERFLGAEFGAAYQMYREQVWALIPGVW